MRGRLTGKKAFVLFIAVSVPALLFMNVWQGVRYSRLEDAVRRLEEEQIAWYERNKNLLAAIGIHSSPKRLDSLAARDPEVRKATPDDTVRVQVEADAGSGGEQGR